MAGGGGGWAAAGTSCCLGLASVGSGAASCDTPPSLDLLAALPQVRVAEGGAGGPCIVGAARGRAARRQQSEARRGGRRRSEEEVDAFELNEQEEIDLVRGKAAPPPTKLLLLLRTVADVGFVGFPNAGKSTLLNALTRARATINSYPFTTLMPNLGAMVPSGGEGGGGGGGGALLADLPGLVEGAHAGRGLGRQFLQQLRRVKVVLFVLDTTSAEVDVGEQYAILRRELQLYNPDYLARPHLVALNKLDTLLQAEGPAALAPETRRLTALLAAAARASAAPGDGPPTPPLAVLPISGMKGKGLRALQEAIAAALADHDAGAEGESDPPHPQ